MLDVFDADGHVRQSLGLHVMGALREDLSMEVDAHLYRCESCRVELRDLQDVTFALALLSADEAEKLADTAATEDGRRGRQPAQRVTVRSGAQRYQLRRLVVAHARMVAVAAVFALVIGFTAGLLLRSSGVPIATAAAHADNQVTGVSLSVTASGRGDKVSIQALVDGLEPGETYHLFLVTSDGVAYVVRQWSSLDGAQSIDQEVDVPIGSLANFTVLDDAGNPVMLAWCRPGPAPTG